MLRLEPGQVRARRDKVAPCPRSEDVAARRFLAAAANPSRPPSWPIRNGPEIHRDLASLHTEPPRKRADRSKITKPAPPAQAPRPASSPQTLPTTHPSVAFRCDTGSETSRPFRTTPANPPASPPPTRQCETHPTPSPRLTL